MRHSSLRLAPSLACVAALFAVACSGNGGGSPVFDPVEGLRDPATSPRDPAGGDRRDPVDTGVSPEGAAAGGGGGNAGAPSEPAAPGGGCIACDKRYRCTAADGDTTDIETETKNGRCEADNAVLACGGTLTVGSRNAGSWTQAGSTLTLVIAGDNPSTVVCQER